MTRQDDLPTPLPVPGPWYAEAACRTENVGFFPTEPRGVLLAKAVCAVCPVQEECLEYAVTNRVSGIWGGTTERDRRRIRSRCKTTPVCETEVTVAIPARPRCPGCNDEGAVVPADTRHWTCLGCRVIWPKAVGT